MATRTKKLPAAQAPVARRHSLAEIAQQIRVLEKRTIYTVIEIGRWLEEAAEVADHGTYMQWLANEFSWSNSTALNFRNVHRFTQNRKNWEFEHPYLNISVSALYLVARLLRDDSGPEAQAIGETIIEAAKRGRVTHKTACSIIEETGKSVKFGTVDHDDGAGSPGEAFRDDNSDDADGSDEPSE
jgi:hypothetical protein